MKQTRLIMLAAALVVIAALSLAASRERIANAQPVCLSSTEEQEEHMSALEFAASMKIGWNLGNTFDAPGGETAWGNPVTTKELLHLVKELGFETIRIPISWGKHVSAAPDYIIEADFLERVDTVVSQALDDGL